MSETHGGAARVGFFETYSTSYRQAGFFCDIRMKFVLILPTGIVLLIASVTAVINKFSHLVTEKKRRVMQKYF
ncbi:hypothetical protein ABIE02_003533 [Leclercia sp. 1548]|uniref:hypothetical protein n=1 Tax=Leclercia TaxID=83654 RepID=UPI0030194A5B